MRALACLLNCFNLQHDPALQTGAIFVEILHTGATCFQVLFEEGSVSLKLLELSEKLFGSSFFSRFLRRPAN